ncbi:hypothetical protein [uncultured Eubacterium sp.]|uniref:hypothetical protein n=1 Tax=uncultured Eubacterium sp. TaxID=165185 RepID=UPI0032648B66
MSTFLDFFFEFITTILDGLKAMGIGLVKGFGALFNFPKFIKIFGEYKDGFSAGEWIAAILSVIVVIAIYVAIIFAIVLVVRKYLRFRKTIVNEEDIVEELADLQRQVIKLNDEKDQIMAMKVAQIGVSGGAYAARQMNAEDGVFDGQTRIMGADGQNMAVAAATKEKEKVVNPAGGRFFKLAEVDAFYKTNPVPKTTKDFDLVSLCESYRNFACSRMNLYYEINTIRIFLAAMASTRLIILQGISGTGKTSLPYSWGKFMEHDSTIASVQPSWRDKTELFGYFNEFSKKFNETEVLKKMYESSFTDDVNLVVLDEMNIARVEYYFADMLSVLEMPNPDEWKINLVPNVWPDDPEKLVDGDLKIPTNMWYIGTANNDDSTFAISDKVYDRAQPINLDVKGVEFEAPDTPPMRISYTRLNELFEEAKAKYPVSEEMVDKINKLDIYVIEKMRLAFGNRIIKQLKDFVPVYVACGGTEVDGVDYVLATKVFRKFESLNLSFIRDEIDNLIKYLDKMFGRENMQESKAYLNRLKKLF